MPHPAPTPRPTPAPSPRNAHGLLYVGCPRTSVHTNCQSSSFRGADIVNRRSDPCEKGATKGALGGRFFPPNLTSTLVTTDVPSRTYVRKPRPLCLPIFFIHRPPSSYRTNPGKPIP